MDLLYSRYSNPLEFMKIYIDQGRFGEFVSDFLKKEYERKREKEEKENDDRLWTAFIHSYSDKSFEEWKRDLIQGQNQKKEPETYSMTNEQVAEVKDQARGILSRISPT